MISMATLDHSVLVREYKTKYNDAKKVLEEISSHISKPKSQGIQDLLSQITELLNRIQTLATPRQLEVEVARSIARDYETIAKRWQELETYVQEQITYDDYLSASDEDRAKHAAQILKIIRGQKLEALNTAGAMYGVAVEWRKAANCFNTVAQTQRHEEAALAPFYAMVREYRCYEELDDLTQVLEIGRALYRVLNSKTDEVSDEEKQVLKEATTFFRKTAMRAITHRQENLDLFVPLGAVFLWCEAEALMLAAEKDDKTALARFKSLAEFFEEMGNEERKRPTPSIERIVSSFIKGSIAYLRITEDLRGFSIEEATQNSQRLQKLVVDFMLNLLERVGYREVRVVGDAEKAAKGLIKQMQLVERGYQGADVFLKLAQQVGDLLVQVQQRENQTITDLLMMYRWLCEGVGLGLRFLSIKLLSEIYRVGVYGEILEVGPKEELRQRAIKLIEVQNDEALFGIFIDAEIKFNDFIDLFKNLELHWIAALGKLGLGRLRQNIAVLEFQMVPEELIEQRVPTTETPVPQIELPFWGAAPSKDFVEAAELFNQAFRSRRHGEEQVARPSLLNSIPYRDADYLRRRAAQSRWLAGLAYFDEGYTGQGIQELTLAKSAYELLGRYHEAIMCFEVLASQLVAPISASTQKEIRPTVERLKDVLEICDELVGLYPLHYTPSAAAERILDRIQFLIDRVGLENWTLSVFLRALEYVRESLRILPEEEKSKRSLEFLQFLHYELSAFLDGEFAIGIYPNFEPETTVYFETETPIKLAVLNISNKTYGQLKLRPVGVLPHLTPNPARPWESSRDESTVSMKFFYVGTDDNAHKLKEQPIHIKPADAFGPPRIPTIQIQNTPTDRELAPDDVTSDSRALTEGEQPWLGVMWSGDYQGIKLGNLPGATEEPSDENESLLSLHELTTEAFFTVFTKSAREGNILPGNIFPVTFGVYNDSSPEPIAQQTVYIKIASRPKILKAETEWATEIKDRWEEKFSIVYEEGAHLPRYVPRFAPESEIKEYVNPEYLMPSITMGVKGVELTKSLKKVPNRFTLHYRGEKIRRLAQHFEVQSSISLEVPMTGALGEYEFLRIRIPSRSMSEEELTVPRLRNGVNFQELFFGTVFIGDSAYDGEYFVYRLWTCFEPGERSPAPGASYRQGWTNHRLDIFLDPTTWEPKLLVTDYYVQTGTNQGEWVEALYSFKGVSSTLFGIRRITADLHREAPPNYYPKELGSEILRVVSPFKIPSAHPLQITGFELGQRLGSIELIRVSWARDKKDGAVTNKPLRTHLFRDYWSQRYEHGLYREDWRGKTNENFYEMRTLDRMGGKSKYVSKYGQRLIPHEVAIIPRDGDRCDLSIKPPGKEDSLTIRNVINPRSIEPWTRPHISFSRRFNFIAKYFGKPPQIHTASLYFYSTRRELNPYYKGTLKGKDQWVHFPEEKYWNGKTWIPFPDHLKEELHPESLSHGINSWLEADAYWVFRYVYYWPFEITLPLPHEDWERADIWVNARTGNIEWITSDYHWRELWYENVAKISGINPIIDFLFNWNTPEPLTVKDGARTHESIVPYFGEGKQIGEFADQLPWMFARYRHSTEHLHQLHASFWGRHKVKIIYGILFLVILLLLFLFTPLRFLLPF
jgi:hypothetical protein